MSVVKSVLGDVDVPEVSLHSTLFAEFSKHADKIAMIDSISGKSYTFNEFIKTCHRVASGLAKLGLKKGDIVSIFSYNTVEWIFMFWGVVCAGGTVTTVNPAYTKYELSNHLNDSGAKFLYTVHDMLDTAKAACQQAPHVQKIICLNGNDSDCIPFTQLSSDDGSLWPKLEQLKFNPKKDIVVIPYSSGTTGLPKGVLLTHYNLMANLMQLVHPSMIDEAAEAEEQASGFQQVTLVILPFYHVYAMVILMMLSFAKGSKSIIVSKFEPRSFLRTIEKYKVTYLPLVPPLVIFMAKSQLVAEYDLSSVMKAGSGAAPLSKDTEHEFKKRINIPDMKQGFGMTETSCVACAFPATKPGRPGACGMLLAGCQAKIVDVSTGKLLGKHERGELWIKGPNIMKGYLNNEKATRETVDIDGYLHTGDIAYYDNDGYFYIVDRIKELIKVKGLQVAPAELEALLLNHPGVADVGVVGLPDERSGELPRAYVVRKPHVAVDEIQILSYVAERTAPFKHLKGGVQFINEIPRLPSGKIIRRKLKELALKSKI